MVAVVKVAPSRTPQSTHCPDSSHCPNHLEDTMPTALFHFHHLLSSKKVSSIRSLTRSLGLGAVYKRGYPGLLLISGANVDDVKALVKVVKAMRWQSCSLCGGGIREDMHVAFEARGAEEVDAVRDVVAAARTGGGVEVEGWVKRGLGLGKEE
ncbi:hypothetical protein BZA05DRAFT_391658 [Tricharina praecox]|uniref:uncharacterized protein n=1 Tax=Tricharina praecox TaxID=43433 RepID=UPI00221FA073|nr:uncharacterized protein BZA05DRAFT_391658 [Tricharina praecox]KAI5855466.1 hypothetical protein BZA05DRAFT_391658 [Tricharina praecox]